MNEPRPVVTLENLVDPVLVEQPSLSALIRRLNEANAAYNEVMKVVRESREAETRCMKVLANIKADIDQWYRDNIRA